MRVGLGCELAELGGLFALEGRVARAPRT